MKNDLDQLDALHERLMSARWYQLLVILVMYGIHELAMGWITGR